MHQLEDFQSLFKIWSEIAKGCCVAVLSSCNQNNTSAQIQIER
ncbi:hypothetical protein SynA1825c_02615 [Synechococcus sp. A18-25c]|nr:hypothetical protein SynA1825c_02615 [Synechococcus sp. A18-25c]